MRLAAFCAVVRPDDHPRRFENYQPLDEVWRHFGYRPDSSLVAHFRWKDLDESAESDKPMQFWIKEVNI